MNVRWSWSVEEEKQVLTRVNKDGLIACRWGIDVFLISEEASKHP